MKSFDPQAFKRQFPLFSHPENQQLVYLDNAATTQKPSLVINAISDFYSRINANANRSGHRLGRAATEMINRTRLKAADFIGAAKKEEIVFTAGATAGINMIAHHCTQTFQLGDEILLSLHEHHANLIPWQEVAKKTGAILQFVDDLQNDWTASVSEKTRLISLTAASNTLGKRTNLAYLADIKKRFPAIWIVLDASQLVAHHLIDVEQLACDFLVYSAHKSYGPSGLGILYGRYDYLNQLTPLMLGGEMIEEVGLQKSHYAEAPRRLEAGTAPLAAIAGYEACLDFWAEQDRQQLITYEQTLNVYLHEALNRLFSADSGYRVLTRAANNVGIATLAHQHLPMSDLAYWLDQHEIAVRVGDHCAQPSWRSMGVHNALRISLAAYNTFNDIDCLIEKIAAFISIVREQDTQSVVKNKHKQQWQSEVEALLTIKNWQKRFKKIMQLAKRYPVMEAIRSTENQIKGCETPLWLSIREEHNRLYFEVDSDSEVVRGLAMVLVSQLSGLSKCEIIDFDEKQLFARLGFEKQISESRINGLFALIMRIKQRCALTNK